MKLLNPKNYGQHYSKKYFKSYLVQDLHLSYDAAAGYLGSKDSLIPNSAYYSFRHVLGGYKSPSSGVSYETVNIELLQNN